MFNYIIIGSGLSGSIIAERMANVLKKSINNRKTKPYWWQLL